jgi:hypothetical protein
MKTALKTEREKNNHRGSLHLPHLFCFPLIGILKRRGRKSSRRRAKIFGSQTVYHVPEQVYTMSPVCTAPRAPRAYTKLAKTNRIERTHGARPTLRVLECGSGAKRSYRFGWGARTTQTSQINTVPK